MILETKNFLLRAWTEEDADTLYLYAKEPEVGELTGWPAHKNREESLNIIRTILSEENVFAIYSKKKKHPIGSIGLHKTENLEEREIGCWLGKEYWNQGIMSEIFPIIINYAFSDLKVKQIIATSFIENSASAKLQKKFHFEILEKNLEKEYSLLGKRKKIQVSILKKEIWVSNKR